MRRPVGKRLARRYERQCRARDATVDRALSAVRAYGERRSVPGAAALLGAIDGIEGRRPSPSARRYVLRPDARP